MRIIVSLFISVLMLCVPEKKYRQELAQLQSVADRNQNFENGGWKFRTVLSPSTQRNHYFFQSTTSSKNAPVLIMLHGFNTDGRIFLNLSPLSDKYHLIAYNLPEEDNEYNGSFDDFISILDDFVKVMGFDTVSLMGLSIGGVISTHYAANSKAVVVKDLTLISTFIGNETPAQKRRSVRMAKKLLAYPDYKLYYLVSRAHGLIKKLEKTGIVEDAPSQLVATKKIAWYRQILSSLRDYEGPAHAGKIRNPVLVIHGSADRVVPLKRGKRIRIHIPQAVMVTVPGGSHSMVHARASEITKALENKRRM